MADVGDGSKAEKLMESSGVPVHLAQWSWSCFVHGKPGAGASGTGIDLDDCKQHFKTAWARIRTGLTESDIASAQEYAETSREALARYDRKRWDMKFKDDRPLATPEAAERKLLELANAVEADHAGRLSVEIINLQFRDAGGSYEEYSAAVKAAIAHGWLTMHPSGGYLSFTQAGADLFA
ncbi:MAG: hypothetical protein ACXWC3_31955 [Burkholderiales bacterium]